MQAVDTTYTSSIFKRAMDRTFTEIENSILSNDVENALNSIINGMKDMLRMIKLSLENSSPSSLIETLEPLLLPAIQKIVNEDLQKKDMTIQALKKIIVQNQKKLDEKEDFVLHLQHRIAQLEEVNKQHFCDCGCGKFEIWHKYESLSEQFQEMFEEITDTQSQVTLLREKFDRNKDLLQPDVSLDSSNDDSSMVDSSAEATPAGSQADALYDIPTDPSPAPLHLQFPDQHNIQEKLNKILKTQQAEEDDKVRRQVLFSNIDLPIVSDGNLDYDRMNFWPKLRTQLHAYDLDFILANAESVSKLKSGSLKVTYRRNYQARAVINSLRNRIGFIKSAPRNSEGLIETPGGHAFSEERTALYLKIKFTRLIPNRYNSKRKILQKLGNHLKESRKINWFDLHVVKDIVYLKTKWRQQNIGIGGQVYYVKKFTHYTVDQAEAILAGLVDVDEDRQAQDRSQRQIRDRYLRA